MKFVRYGKKEPKPGLIDHEGHIRDLSSAMHDLNIEKLMGHPIDVKAFPVVGKESDFHIFPCIPRPGKLICIAFNSKVHTQEMKEEVLTEPFFFIKASSAMCGAKDPLIYPKVGKKLDWEAELCVLIGKKGKHIPKEKALDYVFGYCAMNDVSDRYWQSKTPGKQHVKAKSFDTFAPMGPYLVTKDEIHDPNKLHFIMKINGEVRQDFWTSEYAFNVQTIISYVSDFFTLEPGDAISMGTGPGNAGFWNDQFLKVGDTLEFISHELGTQKQTVIAE